MKRFVALIFFLALTIHISWGQEHVKSFQPTMNVYIKAGFHLSDSITRYFFTSSDSKYSSHHLTYFIDHNLRDKTFSTRAILDSTQQFSALTAAYDLFHVGLPNGSSILGSNGFECDITISDLALIAEDGTTKWALTWSEIFFNEFITSIGQIKPDIIIVNTESGTPYYFNLEGEQEFFGTDPPAYFNIVIIGNNYYGTNDSTIYKLNNDFTIIDLYTGDSIAFFQKVDQDLFLVSTKEGISLIDTSLNVVAASSSITNVLSGAKAAEHIWIVDSVGLRLLDTNLGILKTFLPEPYETMKHVSTYGDTVYVASEYNGLRHSDFVIRKYLPDDSLSTLPADLAISNLHLPDKIIREPSENVPYIFNLRFDSLGIEIFNHGQDTIYSCVINCDWRRSYDPGFMCAYYTNEWIIDSLALPPGDSKLLQLGPFVPGPFYYGIIPNFCFWVDFPDEQPDSNPGNDLLCIEGEIISHTSQVEDLTKIIVYPNPAVDQLTIQNESGQDFNKYFIYTVNGELIDEFSSNTDLVTVSVGDLVPGVYFLMAAMKNKVEYHRFIKQ